MGVKGGDPMRILLAEDEKRMAAALAVLLEHEKYDVDRVGDGASALAAQRAASTTSPSWT